MRSSTTMAVVAAAAGVMAQDQSICDKYTPALTMSDNSPANQYAVLNLLVNRVVTGNTTANDADVNVPGILAPGNVDGTDVDLAPYFTGGLVSTNRNGMAASVNFLDGGAAEPLTAEMPMAANDENSNQFQLLTHLYQYFGALLGCSGYGQDGFPAYEGSMSQYDVHKFMGLSNAEVTYFIQQVGLAAASFGVEEADVTAVGEALTSTFGMRCSGPADVLMNGNSELQAICIADDCPEAAEPTCDAYDAVEEPASASESAMSTGAPTGTPTMTPTAGQTTAGAPEQTTNAAAALSIPMGAGLLAMVMAL